MSEALKKPVQTEQKTNIKKTRAYWESFDIIRVFLLSIVIIIDFAIPIPYFSYVKSLLCFSHGALFTLYGFCVLRDGSDLTKNILHTLKVFLIMLAVYGSLTLVYSWLTTGNPLSVISLRSVINFLVFNIWASSFGSSIWFVQATLYSLVILWLLRKFKKYDCILCIALFVFSILVGELASLINFKFFNYNYIPGGFLTRAMPYMLLGRILHNNYALFVDKLRYLVPILFFGGFALSVGEIVGLKLIGKLAYSNHTVGFIPIAAAVCLFGRNDYYPPMFNGLAKHGSVIYKWMYYTYNPLGYALLIAVALITGSSGILSYFISILVILLTSFLTWFVEFIKENLRREEELSEIDKSLL